MSMKSFFNSEVRSAGRRVRRAYPTMTRRRGPSTGSNAPRDDFGARDKINNRMFGGEYTKLQRVQAPWRNNG